jgi:glycosyltransferase involved in cell wall biosynthesis
MKMTVITPSIRPKGLEVVFKTLQDQSFKEFEWLPRLSVPGPKSDLCYQMNRALEEAHGDLVVFLQDWIRIKPDGLERMWEKYKEDPNACWTAPVGKVKSMDEMNDVGPQWDWRVYWKHREDVDFQRWEIDWGSAPRQALLLAGKFFPRYDEGFGWENVDLAYRMQKIGMRFKVDPDNKAIAFDHDAAAPHPYKHSPNNDLWQMRKGIIDLDYDQTEMEGIEAMEG